MVAEKTSLVVNGTDSGGTRHTLTGSTIGVLHVYANQTITFANVNLNSTNIYSMIAGGGTAIFNNVTANVAQLAWMNPRGINGNTFGNVEIYDSTITLPSTSIQELCEARNVTFGGTVTVNKTNANDATIWIEGDTAGTVSVLDNANVTINTASYFIYRDPACGFSMGNNARLSLTSAGNFTYGTMWLSSFTVGQNSALVFTDSSTGSDGAIRVQGAFTVGVGSTMDISYQGSGGGIRLSGASASATFNDPQRVRIYTNGAQPFYCENNATVTINAGSVGVWTTATSIAQASAPAHFWNKADGQLASFSNPNFTTPGVLTTNITAADIPASE